jgi:hypothetical protein
MLRAALSPVCLRLRSRALRDSLDPRPTAKDDKAVSVTHWIIASRLTPLRKNDNLK